MSGEPRQYQHQQQRTQASPPGASRRSQDDLTWLQFLQAQQADERSNSAERKRRHTGSQGPNERRPPYPTSASHSSESLRRAHQSAMSAAIPAGVSRETAIDLTTPPRSRPTISNLAGGEGRASSQTGSRGSGRGRRESDIVLPRWQPDSEAAACPVCRTGFSFLNRRHHCRKCGRVVCAACSPHRITIPRQYIVQPPNPYDESGLLGIGIEPESPVSRALGGGAVVRVCNPCVPDPWTPDTGSARSGDSPSGQARPLIEGARNAVDVPAGERAERSERYRYMPPPPPPSGSGRIRSQSHQPVSAPFSRSIPGTQSHPAAGILQQGGYSRAAPPAPSAPSPHSRPVSHRYSHSHSQGGPHHGLPPPPPLSRDAIRPSIQTTPSAPPQPKPRRVIKEEDECPVCGTELPPGEQIRESHIQECIASRFSSTPSSSTPMQPPPRRTSSAIPHDGPTITSATPPTTAEGSRPRATSYRPRGMALYKATEKDCTDESGDAQECVICFEEFQPGDEMGRMECLCKFHRTCIRGWWERKGAGSCPTHQLHD